MRILVIGGNRFFGKRLVSKLLDSKADVTLLNRGLLGDPFGDKVKRIAADRKQLSHELPQLKNEKWDVVYDQACYEAEDARKSCQTFSGLVKHYVFTSSESVYAWKGDLKEEDFDPATYRFDSDADRNVNYAEAKRQCETIFTQQNAFPLTSFRFPFVVGPDDYTRRLRFHVEEISQKVVDLRKSA
jgi:nucleoside-diphosphate-sugar epimerase